jgi:4Fe-4S ferredoxin
MWIDVAVGERTLQAKLTGMAANSRSLGSAAAYLFKGKLLMINHKDAAADCKFAAGIMIPVIDPMRCEAAGPCIPICPYQVLAIREVTAMEKAKMPLIGRLKLFVHGGKQAFAVDPDSCHGCGLCVKACPEKAIKLHKLDKE